MTKTLTESADEHILMAQSLGIEMSKTQMVMLRQMYFSGAGHVINSVLDRSRTPEQRTMDLESMYRELLDNIETAKAYFDRTVGDLMSEALRSQRH